MATLILKLIETHLTVDMGSQDFRALMLWTKRIVDESELEI